VANEEEIIKLLKGIREDTKIIPILENEVKRLKKLEEDFESKTIHTVENNNSLAEYFKKLSKEVTITYLTSDDARQSLITTIKEIFVRELNLRLVKILAWQASIFTALFIAYAKLWIE